MLSDTENQPVVSIRLMTYNHSQFIDKALHGIDSQKTKFSFEVIVGDDFSDDKTKSIIENFPFTNNRIYVNILDREIGGDYYKKRLKYGRFHNFSDILDNCKGKYIALLDGDDYWIDPLKLQKQVDFLEKHPGCSFCFHKAEMRNEELDVLSKEFPENINQKILSTSDYLKITTTATSSLVFRNSQVKVLKSLFHSHADFLIYCELLEKGKAGYIDDVMSVYRKHEGGVSYNYSSPGYLFNRIKELKIERSYFTSPSIKREISRIIKEHVLRYISLYRNKLSWEQIKFFTCELIINKSFYRDLLRKAVTKFRLQ